MKTPTQGIKHYLASQQDRVVDIARCLYHIPRESRSERVRGRVSAVRR